MLMTQERKCTKEDHLNNLAKYEPRKDRAMFLRGFSLMSDQPVANDRLTAGYGYDADGSTTIDPAGKTYTYDSLDRLLTVTP